MAKNLVTLHNGFRILDASPVGATVSTALGSGSVSLTGSFFLSIAGTVDGIRYESLIDKFADYATDAGNAGITGSFDPATERVFFSSDTSFALTFSAESSSKMFGFSIGASASVQNVGSGQYGVSGSRVPWNHWRESEDSRSEWKRDYEPKPIHFDHIADDGTIYSFGKSGSVIHSDWVFDVQPQDRVRASFAPLDRPFTWETMIKQVRTIYPIAVFTGSNVYSWNNKEHIYQFRGEGSKFDPEHIMPDYEDWLRLPVLFYVLG